MATTIRAATRLQIGKETTRGTAVAATRALATKSATYRIREEFEEHAGQMSGNLARASVAPILKRTWTEFEFTNDLEFTQILLFLLSGMKGGVTPTTPGSGEARLWTFTPSPTVDPAPDTYTLEYAERDMESSPNELSNEAPYAFTKEIEISASEDATPQLSASMVARVSSLTASTGALTLPTPEVVTTPLAGLWIDATWAGLGTTAITGQIFGVTWRWSDFLREAWYFDNRSTKDFSQYEFPGRDEGRVADLTIDAVMGAASGDLVPTEDALKTAGTKRFVRVQFSGSAFDAPDNGLSRFIRLDGCFIHAPDSMEERGQDKDGNKIIRLHLLSFYDSTQAQDVEISCQNNLATFP